MTTAQVPYVLGVPGMRSAITAEHRRVLTSTSPLFLPGGKFIDGTKARDPGNSPYVEALRAGLILGKDSSGKYSNSVIGTTTGALAQAGTSITISAAAATELVRRIGASGDLTLSGPPSAGGTARQVQFAYSAVNTTTGVVTLTAGGANQVEQVRLNPAATGGNLQLTVQKTDGTYVTTGNIAWNATDATFLASINTALDTATGVVGGIVATAIAATDTDLGFVLTYSGTGYAGQTWASAQVAVLPTSSTDWYVVPVTAAVDARFIAGSYVGDTDGSELPRILLPDGTPIPTTDLINTTGINPLPLPQIPVAALVATAYVVDYPTDAGMITWLKQSLGFDGGPKLIFDDGF